MHSAADLAKILANIVPVPANGLFPRRVPIAPLFDLTGPFTAGSTATIRIPTFLRPSVKAGRFNPGGLKTLYVAGDEATAEAEVYHPGLSGILAPRSPDAIYQVEVSLQRVLDLTEASILAQLGTGAAELAKSWRTGTAASPTATQMLGAAAAAGNFEAIRSESVQFRGKHCLAIFPDKLIPGSTITLVDPFGVFRERVGGAP